jgi:hypothetical protein
MPTKPVTLLSLGAMILIMTALAQTSLAADQAIELAQAHSTEGREACDHAGGGRAAVAQLRPHLLASP